MINPNVRFFKAVHETASDLHCLGFIDRRKTCKFDVFICIRYRIMAAKKTGITSSPSLSQAVPRAVLNAGLLTAGKWESGGRQSFVKATLSFGSKRYGSRALAEFRKASFQYSQRASALPLG
ncbi:hypothetical protein [Methylobacter sp.]|uniref:hypothetical protein n=1 Tax=Methylobacter sp. TaxID=2051955 RepID=UPI002FE29292